MSLPVSFEFRMMWRELGPAWAKFTFMVAAIALGVGSLTGIKGFTQALEQAMARTARDLIASDLAVRLTAAPDREELRAFESLIQQGARMTRVTETMSMATTTKSRQPLLTTVKAVDPQLYPFYGKIELDPAQEFRKALTDETAIVSQEFLIRTNGQVGDVLVVGETRFSIVAVLKVEPDRLASGVDLGPRILITRRGLERSGLIQFGSRASEAFLFRLPSDMSLESAHETLRTVLKKRVRIADYRDPNPSVSRGLERMSTYLSLIALLAILVGGLGVATTIHTYLQQKLDSIAIVKCLGGRSAQIIRIYLMQGLLLGAVGSLAGIGIGYLLQLAFPSFLEGLLDLPAELELAPGAAVQGFLIGMSTTLLFLLPPLLAIGKIRPVRLFLRELPETRLSALEQLRHDALPLASSAILIFGVGLLACWLADSWVRGFSFMAGLAGAILVLTAAARLLLLALKHVPRPSSLAMRHGLRNLRRPGSHMTSVLVALGIGVAFVTTVYHIQYSLIPQIMKSAPADFPNLFLLGITERNKEQVWEFLRSRAGVRDAGNPIPAIPARLRRIDGKTAGEQDLEDSEQRYFHIEFVLSWARDIPPDTRVIEGEWWRPPYSEPMISVGEHAARHLKIRVGSILDFESSGKSIRGRVANIRDTGFSRPGSNNQFLFSPGALDGYPASYVGGLRVDEEEVVYLQSALFDRFPGITSIDVGQVLVRIQHLLDQVTTVIRFVAVFAILAGIIILASSVASTRMQRIREAALLKTLGATRSQVARIHAAEFLIIGLTAGFIGCILAAIAAHYLLGTLLETDFRFRWMPLVIGTLATSAMAIATGWLTSRGVMNHRPIEVLREN